MNIPNEITETRSALLAQQPFFASLLYGLVKETSYDPTCKTAATDGEVIKLGDWFCKLPIAERTFVLCHEIAHVMFDHMGRTKLYLDRGFGPDMLPFDQTKMNCAQDYVINAIFKDAGIGKMPRQGLWDPQYTADMLPDVVYTKLPPSPPSQPKDPGGAGPGHGGFDQHLPAPGPSTPQADAGRKAAIVAAANAARAMGKMPGSLARVIGEIIEPKQDWRDILRDMMEVSAGQDDLSWSRPRRRSLALPPHIPMPGRTGHRMGAVVLAIDTSGSIGEREMSLFMGAMREIITQVSPAELHVIWWDTAAIHEEVEDMDDLTRLHPVGGGGTNYSCVPPVIDDLDLNPDVVVCLTDGAVRFPPADAVRWPHITVSTTNRTCPFGRNVKMEV